MNNLLLVISIVGVFGLLLLTKKLLGKEGIIGFMGIASILANMLILKSVDMLGISATLGNVLFASNFLATDILSENYGYKEAKKGVKFAILSVILYLIVGQFSLLFKPNALDIAQPMFETLFSFAPRITLASVSMFALSNFVDIRLYEFLKKKTNGKKMWLRNNVCTVICNGGENFLFYIIAFGLTMPMSEILMIALSATIIEIIIAICDTPFLYLSKKIKN